MKMEHIYLALNVGGQMFHIRVSSLRSIPRTLLTDLIDASLPPDLVFGGKAISEEDGRAPCDWKSVDHIHSVKTTSYDSTGISTNGASVTPTHPYDRAKYVYLSCSNRFRPIRLSPSSSTSSTPSLQNSPLRDVSEKTTSTTTSTASPKTPISSSTAAQLYIPATCLTSPRHKSENMPTHASRTRLEGFTNKSFVGDENHSDRSQAVYLTHANVINADNNSIHASARSGANHLYPALEHEDKESVENVTDMPQEINTSSAVYLPLATGADVYVDRNPLLFPYILDLYRNGQLHLPPDICSLTIRMEMDFWKIPEELIGECCWREFQNGIDRMDVVSAISATLTDRFDDPEVRDQLTRSGRIWLTMERPDYSKRAKMWCAVYYLFILLSIITFMLLTLADFQEVKPEFKTRLEEYTDDNDTLHVVHTGTFHKPVDWLEATEICLDIFFTLEFAARLITCPDKKEFVRNKHNIIDIMILSTAWTRCIYDRIITWDHKNFTEARSFAMVVLNSMLGIRVLRMLHLAKIFRTLKVMYLSILASMQELALLVVVMGAGVLLFGSALYIAEGFSTPDNEPLQFKSIPEAMWWAIITMTTVGYGDYYPEHAAGYVVGAVCAVSGLLLVAMPIAIVASNFSVFYDNMSSRDQSLRRQAMLGQMIGIAMAAQETPWNGGGVGVGATGQEETPRGSDPLSGSDLDTSESVARKRHTSGGTKEVAETSVGVASRPDGLPRVNGYVGTKSRDMSQRRTTGDKYDSRRDKQGQKPRSSGASRQDRSSSHRGKSSREGDEKDDVNLADDVKYHRSRNSDNEVGSGRARSSAPITVGYVGVRTDGVGKDQLEDEDGSAKENFILNEQHSSGNSERQERKSNGSDRSPRRTRHRSGHSTTQLSPVG